MSWSGGQPRAEEPWWDRFARTYVSAPGCPSDSILGGTLRCAAFCAQSTCLAPRSSLPCAVALGYLASLSAPPVRTMASSTGSSELTFLLEREGVEADFQTKLLGAGVNTVGKFAALVDSQAELRDLLKDEFGMDSRAGGLKVKAAVAAVLVSWAAAKKRQEKRAELEGELDARGEPKPVGVNDALAMKQAFETRFWTLEEERTPSRTYLEKKLEQVEKNDLRAELLTEVLCQRDDGDEVLKPVWDTALSLKAVKVARKIAAPANPEQLRRRFATMGAAWVFVAAAHPSRPYLQGVGMQVWTEFGDYLLGRYVLGSWWCRWGGPWGRRLAHCARL